MRPTKDEYFMEIAHVVSKRSTCARRNVGAVIIDKYDHILSTGYNGVARGLPHCLDEPCGGVDYPSGEGHNACLAIHAEQNALLQCPNTESIDTIYCTVAPCITCLKLLLNTSCQKIVYDEEYVHLDSKELWEKSGRIWTSSRVQSS